MYLTDGPSIFLPDFTAGAQAAISALPEFQDARAVVTQEVDTALRGKRLGFSHFFLHAATREREDALPYSIHA